MFVNKNHEFQLWFYALKSFATTKKKSVQSLAIKQIVLWLLKCVPIFTTKAAIWKTTNEETTTVSYCFFQAAMVGKKKLF